MMNEKKIAIVGTSKLDNVEENLCIDVCRKIFEKYQPCIFLYGGADGVDSVALRATNYLWIVVIDIKPKNQRWTPQGFK